MEVGIATLIFTLATRVGPSLMQTMNTISVNLRRIIVIDSADSKRRILMVSIVVSNIRVK
jgi:hypothetical protein